MAANITWVITALDCSTTDINPDTVVTAHWSCFGEESGYTTSVYSTCSFPPPEGTFIPYADLTQDQVLNWCWTNGVDKDATEQAVQTNLDNLINPPIITPPLPWAQPVV